VAAYLLGALPELEEQAVERHVMGCADCRDEMERLRPAVEALPRSVIQLEAPPRLRQSIMAAIAADSRANAAASGRDGILARSLSRVGSPLAGVRPARAFALAAALLAAGVLGIGVGGLLSGASDEARIAAQVDESRLAEGSGTLVVSEGEDEAVLSVHGVPTLPDRRSSDVYQAWLVRGDEVIPSSVFSVDSKGAGAATLIEDLEHVDAVWITREPAGGSRAPSERPVMEVDLQ
jgi:anti-sigma factor RsiW